MVWLSTSDLRDKTGNNKSNAHYIGPYKITKQISPVSYCLALPQHMKINPTFHVSLLKKYVPGQQENFVMSPAPWEIDEKPTYTIRSIQKSSRRDGI